MHNPPQKTYLKRWKKVVPKSIPFLPPTFAFPLYTASWYFTQIKNYIWTVKKCIVRQSMCTQTAHRGPTTEKKFQIFFYFLSQFYMYYCKTMMFKQLWYYCGILYYNNWRYNKVWNLTENRNWRYEIWPKNALLASKHDVPLGCTSLVVSNHFSEFLYGIYRQALTLI